MVIKSIEIAPESTFLLANDGSEIHEIPIDNLPQQVHASRVTNNFVTLDPDQGAIVPLTFLPRFPPLQVEEGTLVELPSQLSPWQQADREGWLGSISVRNNLEAEIYEVEIYRVSTTLLVETNYGVAKVPFEANSVRDNPFALPDMIFFTTQTNVDAQHENIKSLQHQNFMAENGVRIYDTFWNPYATDDSGFDQDCYDLYIEHPRESYSSIDIQIHEIFVSRPESMSVQVLSEKESKTELLDVGPQHAIRQWTDEGPLFIPPDDAKHYLATICTESEGVARDAEADQQVREEASWIDQQGVEGSLGFLQIRTDSETLFVSLVENGDVMSDSNTIKYYADDYPDEDEDNEDQNEPHSHAIDSRSLQASPRELNIFLLDGTSNSVSLPVGLNNTGSSKITILKTSVAFHNMAASKLKVHGVNLAMDTSGLDESRWILDAGETIHAALSVNVSWSLEKGTNFTAECAGVITVQGSPSNTSIASWVKSVRADPSLDAEVVAEIPFVVHFIDGIVQLAASDSDIPFKELALVESTTEQDSQVVKAAFFPAERKALMLLGSSRGFDLADTKRLEYEFSLFSTIDFNLSLREAHIIEDEQLSSESNQSGLCSCFTVSTPAAGSDRVSLKLKYEFPRSEFLARYLHTQSLLAPSVYPTTCLLRYSTYPETGEHSLPMLVYPGTVDLSVGRATERDDPPSHSRFARSTSSIESSVGFSSMLEWFRQSVIGASLKALLGSKRSESDDSLLARYLHGLAKSPLTSDPAMMRPVLLKVGAINPDEMETLPIFVTNHNPVHALVTVETGEVEGMSVNLGRDPVQGHSSSILYQSPASQSYMRSDSKIKRGHPVRGLFQYLSTDTFAKNALSFGYRDAIKMSQTASSRNSLLKELYLTRSEVEYHKKSSHLTNSSCVGLESSLSFTSFVAKNKGRKTVGPVTISIDSNSVKSLQICSNVSKSPVQSQKNKADGILVPPGGVARFDIQLRSPAVATLDHDINHFLSTGLVLSTGYGDVLPIFVTYETPRGKLDVSPLLGEEGVESLSDDGVRTIRVPAGLFGTATAQIQRSVKILPKSRSLGGLFASDIVAMPAASGEKGVSLYMTSSFNREVELLEVSSCNPWFEVSLHDDDAPPRNDPLLGVNIGRVKSVVSCLSSGDIVATSSSMPSFYSCALNWALGRSELQPPGCGSRVLSDDQGRDSKEMLSSERIDYDMAITALNRAVALSNWSWGKSKTLKRPRTSDGKIAPAVVDASASAWNIWKTAPESKLLRLSTSLRAVISYNSSERVGKEDSEPHLLSLAMRNLTIESILELPKLFQADAESPEGEERSRGISFPETFVGDVSSRMIKVANPTATSVRVRIAVAPEDSVFDSYSGDGILKVPEAMRKDFLTSAAIPYTQDGANPESIGDHVSQQWWDGSGSFFMADPSGGLLRSHYNITVRAGSGAFVSLLSPGLLANVAFVTGCGARCAVREEIVKGDGSHDVRKTSFIGASAAEQSVLIGRTRSGEDQKPALVLEAGGSLHTGGKGPPAFAIPFDALQKEVEIPPYGKAELGPVLFRPPGRTQSFGCESTFRTTQMLPPECIDSRDFTSTLFLENSLTGLERVSLNGRAMWERVSFQDIPLDVEEDGDFSDIEMRNGREALIFSGTSKVHTYDSTSSVKQLALRNTGDVPVSFYPPYLADTASLNRDESLSKKGSCKLGEFSFIPCPSSDATIHLKPGENYTIFVQHEPKCTQSSSFVALVYEYGRESAMGAEGSSPLFKSRSRKDPFRKRKERLLLGYDMTPGDFARCIPSGDHAVVKFIEVLEYVGLKRPRNSIFEGSGLVAVFIFACTYTLAILGITASALILARRLYSRASRTSTFRARLLRGTKRSNRSLQLDSNWLATLRCLSRLDPGSQDLQTLGREQTRLILLKQFRVHGVLAPMCLNSSGQFCRDRRTVQPRGKTGLSSSGGSDRIRTLSDALFQNTSPCFSDQCFVTSYGVGLKMILSRGIIDGKLLDNVDETLSTEVLLSLRKEIPSSQHADYDSISASNESDESEETGAMNDEFAYVSERSRATGTGDANEIDSDSESDDLGVDAPISEPRVGKVVVASSRHLRDDKALSDVESAEFQKITAKGKPVKKLDRAPRNVVYEIEPKKAHSTQQNRNSRKTTRNQTSDQAQSQRQSKSHAGIRSELKKGKKGNGELSTKAKPFVPSSPPPAVESSITSKLQSSKKESTLKETSLGSSENAGQKNVAAPRMPTTLRPPPGLAPPPGFGGSASHPSSMDVSASFTASNTSLSESTTPTSHPVNPPPLLDRETSNFPALTTTKLPEPLAGPPTGLENEALGSLLLSNHGSTTNPPLHQDPNTNPTAGEFDVMDFLDSILDEGAPSAPSPAESGSIMPEKSMNQSLFLVPSNPWAASQESAQTDESRASDYGISFGGGTDSRAESDIPMLTPEALLRGSNGSAQDSDNDDDDENGDMHNSTFYTSLLK